MQFTATGVCVAHVSRATDGLPKVGCCRIVEMDSGDERALEKLGKEMHLSRYRRTFILNSGQYQMLMLEAPKVPAAELRTAVRWSIKDMVDFPVAEATLDVLQIPLDQSAGTRAGSLFVVAARNEIIRRRMAVFENTGLPLAAIDIPELAQRNIATLLEEDGRGLAMLSFSEDGGLLTISQGGELYSSRHIDIPLSQLEQAGSEQRQRLFERITLELQRSFDHFERQFHHVALSRLMLAPLPPEINLEAYLASNLYMPVASMVLDEVFDFSALAGVGLAVRLQCLYVLGAALRVEGKVS